jgi:hypothetical protein
MKQLVLAIALFVIAAIADAGERAPMKGVNAEPVAAHQLSAKQRGAVARMLVERWAPEVVDKASMSGNGR